MWFVIQYERIQDSIIVCQQNWVWLIHIIPSFLIRYYWHSVSTYWIFKYNIFKQYAAIQKYSFADNIVKSLKSEYEACLQIICARNHNIRTILYSCDLGLAMVLRNSIWFYISVVICVIIQTFDYHMYWFAVRFIVKNLGKKIRDLIISKYMLNRYWRYCIEAKLS